MRTSPPLIVRLIAYTVMAHGLLIIFETLVEEISIRGRLHVSWHHFLATSSLLAGLSLLYISMHLLRRKRTAWACALLVYAFLAAVSITHLSLVPRNPFALSVGLRDLLIPGLLAVSLILARREFRVKSDIRSFAIALRISLLILLVTGLYGVLGFTLLDQRDFHQEISLSEAIHRTVDQLDLTTTQPLQPYTRRAHLFVASLSTVSIVALVYAFGSLFQPLRVRFASHESDREVANQLLRHYLANSEDFFKLWPHDKYYFFNGARTAGLAYTVRHGIALVVGDPMGDPKSFSALLNDFDELCRTNDWAPAYVHVEATHEALYKDKDFSLQKIGEEAVVDLHHFNTSVRKNKYFRQITNKFTKQGYYCDIVAAPHDPALLRRLQDVSTQWLTLPGRSERGFMMGYFSNAYMQQCTLVLLKDNHDVVQGFLNIIPSFDKHEANFDLLRHSKDALGNSNDFMLLAFIDYAVQHGYTHLNLGLCPLSGLGDKDEARTVIGNALQFLYANGDRFYSFSGLRRFKAKYEPIWRSRYIVYRGGIAGFTRRLNALNRAMKP